LQWTHLLINSDWNSSNWLFSAKLGGLETPPQYKKALRAAPPVGFSRLPWTKAGIYPAEYTQQTSWLNGYFILRIAALCRWMVPLMPGLKTASMKVSQSLRYFEMTQTLSFQRTCLCHFDERSEEKSYRSSLADDI